MRRSTGAQTVANCSRAPHLTGKEQNLCAARSPLDGCLHERREAQLIRLVDANTAEVVQ